MTQTCSLKSIPKSSIAQSVPADFTGQSEALTRLVLVVMFPLGAALIHIWTLYMLGYYPHSSVVVLQLFFNEVFRGTSMLVRYNK